MLWKRQMFNIKTINNISDKGLSRLPADAYAVSPNIENPDAIILRSQNLHEMEIPSNLKAVGRAGAGTNNVPVEKLGEQGVVVFNAPGANANAVKELVISGMLLACRNICQAWQYAANVEGTDEEQGKAVEAGKKKFVGYELPGRTLGVVGLGAIGDLFLKGFDLADFDGNFPTGIVFFFCARKRLHAAIAFGGTGRQRQAANQ
jgi:D-3-phosphoglycerate dehydrogenase